MHHGKFFIFSAWKPTQSCAAGKICSAFQNVFDLLAQKFFFGGMQTPCQLGGVGSDRIVDAIKQELGISQGETTPDGLFTFVEVECLGACVNAPMIQINDDYYEDLTPDTVTKLLRAIRENAKDPKVAIPQPGPQGPGARQTCENSAGLTSLTAEPWGTEATRPDL